MGRIARLVLRRAGGSAGFTFNQTEESASETTRSYENSLATEKEVTSGFTVEREVTGAVMQVAVSLRNVSNLAYRVKNLQVTAFIQDPLDHTRLTPVATLLPDSEPAEGYTLGPLVADRGPIIFSNSTIVPTLVESLMANSSGLIFRISNYDIINEDGRNFAFVNQDVVERTSQVVVDYGGASSLVAKVSGVPVDPNQPGDETEIHRVATSAGRVIDTDGDGTINEAAHRQSATVEFPPQFSTTAFPIPGVLDAYEDGGEATNGGSHGDIAFWGPAPPDRWQHLGRVQVSLHDHRGHGPGLRFQCLQGRDHRDRHGRRPDRKPRPDFPAPGEPVGLRHPGLPHPVPGLAGGHLSIPIGQYKQFLGKNNYLTFVMDNDQPTPTTGESSGSASFTNVSLTRDYEGDHRVIFNPNTGKEVGITLAEGMSAIGLTRYEARLDPFTGKYLEYEPGGTKPVDFTNRDDLYLSSYSTFIDDTKAVPDKTDANLDSVYYKVDPRFVTGLLVQVDADGGGLTAGTDYFIRKLGGGSYSFFKTVMGPPRMTPRIASTSRGTSPPASSAAARRSTAFAASPTTRSTRSTGRS